MLYPNAEFKTTFLCDFFFQILRERERPCGESCTGERSHQTTPPAPAMLAPVFDMCVCGGGGGGGGGVGVCLHACVHAHTLQTQRIDTQTKTHVRSLIQHPPPPHTHTHSLFILSMISTIPRSSIPVENTVSILRTHSTYRLLILFNDVNNTALEHEHLLSHLCSVSGLDRRRV
jgi:hypothetical protein